jgi:hypothetical protein
MKAERKLHPVEMPAIDSKRPAVFLYYSLNGVDTELKLNPIALAELPFRHDPFS